MPTAVAIHCSGMSAAAMTASTLVPGGSAVAAASQDALPAATGRGAWAEEVPSRLRLRRCYRCVPDLADGHACVSGHCESGVAAEDSRARLSECIAIDAWEGIRWVLIRDEMSGRRKPRGESGAG